MNIIWIIIGIFLLLLLLRCLKKQSKIEGFKVIYKSLDNFNTKPIIEAINDTFNEIQHLKAEASILDGDKYKNMYNWYKNESYTHNNLNNRKILLGNSKNKSEQKKEVMKNMRSVKENQKELQNMIDRRKNSKPRSKHGLYSTISMCNNLSSQTIKKNLDSKDIKDLQNEWVKASTSKLMKEKNIYINSLSDLNNENFDNEVERLYKEFIRKCTKCGFKCYIHDMSCNDTENDIKDGLLEVIKKPKRKKIMEGAREEAIKILMLRNLRDKNKLKYEIQLMNEETIGNDSSKEMKKWDTRA